MRKHPWIAVVLATLFFALPACAAKIGTPAPVFSVLDINGKTQSLAQYAGHIVVLEWNNPGCPFVHKHYDTGTMQALQTYAVDHGVVWLTINSGAAGKEGSMTPAEAHAQLAAWNAHPTAYILDPEGTLGHLYGATATPHMFVIDAHGALAYAGAIDDRPTADKADIQGAHSYVRAALDSLLAGKPVEVPAVHVYGCGVKYKG